MGNIILHLWGHPLGEPRKAILDLVRASLPRTERAASGDTGFSTTKEDARQNNGDHGGGGSGGGGAVENSVMTDFFTAVFDIITYGVGDGMERLKDGSTEEKSNGGKALTAGHPHWTKYQRDRKQSIGMLKRM